MDLGLYRPIEIVSHMVMLRVTTAIGCQNGGCTCKAIMMNFHNSHALVVSFAVQVTSGAKSQ